MSFFSQRRCFFGLFLPLLRVSARGTKRCKNRLDAAESTGVYVTYLVLRASFLSSLQSCLFHLFFAARSHFFALFRSGEVFEANYQINAIKRMHKYGEIRPENNATLLFCEQTKFKMSRTDSDIKKYVTKQT